MHPMLAQYLKLETAVRTLQRELAGGDLTAAERTYAQTARAHPERRALILAAHGQTRPSAETQQALLFLSTHAALLATREDPTLGPKLRRAQAALQDEGASPEESQHLLAGVVLEEAFGFLNEDDTFDAPFFAETLDSLPKLASLSSQGVQRLVQEAIASAPPAEQALQQRAADALFETAWGEGPEPINSEHLEATIEQLFDQLPSAERVGLGPVLTRMVHLLAREALIGPLRAQRLLATIAEAEIDPLPEGPLH